MPAIVVVGDIDTDIFYLVPHIPTWDEGVLVDKSYTLPGGKGANTACVLSSLGTNTGLVAVVGDDYYGEIGLAGLRKYAVEMDGVIIRDDAETYHCIMMLDDTGEKAILVKHTDITYPSQDELELKAPYLMSARHVHYIALDPLRMLGSILKMKKHGLTVSADFDAAYPGIDACREVIRNADIIFVNRQGAERLFPGKPCDEALSEMLKLGTGIAVITLGSEGALAGNHEGIIARVTGYAVPVVDTTGSGDTFSGAFVHAISQCQDLRYALQFASAAAAISIQKIGGQGSVPTAEQVARFLSTGDFSDEC